MTNPVITNNDIGSVVLFNGVFRYITLNASGAITYPIGTVLAFDPVADKWKITESGTPVVANAKCVLAEEVVFTGSGDKNNVRAIIGGRVDETKLIFDGADTADTIPAGAADSFRIQLRSYNIIIEDPSELRIQDNQ